MAGAWTKPKTLNELFEVARQENMALGIGALLAAEIPEAERDQTAAYVEFFTEAPVANVYLHAADYDQSCRWPDGLCAAPGHRKVVVIVRDVAAGESVAFHKIVARPTPPAGMSYPVQLGAVPRFPSRERGVYHYETGVYQHGGRLTDAAPTAVTIMGVAPDAH